MPSKKIEELYQKIGEKIYEIIPEDWSKVYLYAEVLSDSRIVYFYFETPLRSNIVYCHNIPDEFKVDEKIYWELHSELVECFEKLNKEFELDTNGTWTNLTMYLDASGKFKMDYNYDDISKSQLGPSEQQTIWKYEILGIYPSSEDNIKLIEDYLKYKGNK